MTGTSVCMLLIVTALSVSGGAQASASDRDANQSQQVKGDDIAALLEGKAITPSLRYQQNAPPAGEWFGIDHQWHASLQSFSLQQIAGTWDVEGNSICVMRIDKPRFCRAVWRNAKSGEISIAMVPDWSTTAKPIFVDVVEHRWGLAK
jgi:hypothetical protein